MREVLGSSNSRRSTDSSGDTHIAVQRYTRDDLSSQERRIGPPVEASHNRYGRRSSIDELGGRNFVTALLLTKELEGVQDLAPAFDYVKNLGAQALVFNTDNLMFGRRKEIAALALSHHLPSIHSFAPEVEDGGLMSYGPDLAENYRRAAALADRVLKGARPADLPVEEPTQFSLFINLKTAKAFGVMIPPMLLGRADEVMDRGAGSSSRSSAVRPRRGRLRRERSSRRCLWSDYSTAVHLRPSRLW